MANLTYEAQQQGPNETVKWTIGNCTITVSKPAGEEVVEYVQVREQLRALYGNPNG